MAVDWQWFFDSIPGTEFPNSGNLIQGHRQLLQGESVQRVIGQGGYSNYFAYSVVGATDALLPYPFTYSLYMYLQYDDTHTEGFALREGSCYMQFNEFGNATSTRGVYTWQILPGALDFDVTIRKRMTGTSTNMGVHWTLNIAQRGGFLANFTLPDGIWVGDYRIRTLRTAPA